MVKEKEKLDGLLVDPSKLEGRMIGHKGEHEGDVWLKAKVVNMVEERRNNMQSTISSIRNTLTKYGHYFIAGFKERKLTDP